MTDTRLHQTGNQKRLAYKVPQVAELLGVHRDSVYALCASGALRAVRLAGGTMIIPAVALEKYLAE